MEGTLFHLDDPEVEILGHAPLHYQCDLWAWIENPDVSTYSAFARVEAGLVPLIGLPGESATAYVQVDYGGPGEGEASASLDCDLGEVYFVRRTVIGAWGLISNGRQWLRSVTVEEGNAIADPDFPGQYRILPNVSTFRLSIASRVGVDGTAAVLLTWLGRTSMDNVHENGAPAGLTCAIRDPLDAVTVLDSGLGYLHLEFSDTLEWTWYPDPPPFGHWEGARFSAADQEQTPVWQGQTYAHTVTYEYAPGPWTHEARSRLGKRLVAQANFGALNIDRYNDDTLTDTVAVEATGVWGAWLGARPCNAMDLVYSQDDTVKHRISYDEGATWSMATTVAVGYQYPSAYLDARAGMLPVMMWNDTNDSWYLTVGTLDGGSWSWSAPRLIAAGLPGATLNRRADGAYEFTYTNASWEVTILRCNDLLLDGSGAWS